ncbi:MAG: hypothetical protein KGM99_05590 [Burkholderiales bacterium]|nr:hypothetical protein [Burkholderiales bacterium]
MSIAQYLSATFPGVRVTSTKRDPNSPLGRANPRSYHNIGQAVDIAPIPGMSFDDYVNRVKQDYNVLEARDEVNNPSAHATGPHWHLAYGDRKEQQVNPFNRPQTGYQTPGYGGDIQGQPRIGLANLLDPTAQIDAPQQDNTGLASLMPTEKAYKRGTGRDILGTIFDAMATFGGGQPNYWNSVNQEKQDLQAQVDAERQRMAQLRQPKYMEVGGNLISLNQETGQATPVYSPGPKQPDWLGDAQAFNALTPEQKAMVTQFLDVKNPIAVSGPQGTYRVPRGYGQPQTQQVQQIDGRKYVNVNGQWMEME